MGYRSDWKIIFNTCGKAQQVCDTLHQYVSAHTSDASGLLGEMLKSAVDQIDDDLLVLGDNGWKLYAWDDLTHIITTLFADDPEIDIGWIRLGEDSDDNESQSSKFTRMYFSRSIDYDYDTPSDRTTSDITVPSVCQCDINQLYRGDGHDQGCPDGRLP
jgi:hypothetical protein